MDTLLFLPQQNLGNDAMLELATLPNIRGVKDCSADMAQSFDLLRRKPEAFAVLTGEDAFFHPMLTQGAEGGIIASEAPIHASNVQLVVYAEDADGKLGLDDLPEA